ncbi:MAG: RluA family pseudouridine synthase [Pyrinomonadaceae bacterium]
MNEALHLTVGTADNKKRLDIFLFETLTGLSKMYLRDLIKYDKCQVNGHFENRGYKLRANDFVEIEADLTRENAMKPENIPIDVVFEDDELLVVHKPAGMLVHPTHRDKNGTLLNALSFYLNSKADLGFLRPGLVHRLDKQTSGLLVIAKTDHAHRVLADHFKRKLVEKRYLALVGGVVEPENGLIEAPIGRYSDLKLWNIKDDGKHSETRFWVRRRFADTTLLDLEPVTGRTNQLRIHCHHFGHPIVGDTLRGGRDSERLWLHAYKLSFRHPTSGDRMEFESRAPEGMLNASADR